MLRSLSLWPDFVMFLMSYPTWHASRHSPRPSWHQLKTRYDLARRRHNGQGEAWANLNRATHEALRREVYGR